MNIKKALSLFLSVMLLIFSTTIPVSAIGVEEQLTFSCGTDPSIIEEAHKALLQSRTAELQQEMGIASFSAMQNQMPTHKNMELMPSTGTINMVVIPISYSDYPQYRESFDREFTYNEFFAPYNPESNMPNQSVRGFYYWSSYGMLNIEGTVLEPYEAPNPSTFYYDDGLDANDTRALLKDALNYYIEQGVDFSKYDNNENGLLDAVYIKSLRPYRTHYTTYVYKEGPFVFASLPTYSDGREDFDEERRVAEHEIGHLMGLPDNYSAYGTENLLDLYLYELMQGGWPQSMYINTYYKYLLGWVKPLILTDEGGGLQKINLAPVETYSSDPPNAPRAVVIIPNTVMFPYTEYYLAEYRGGGLLKYFGGLSSFDYTPGIVIWHVNTSLDSNMNYKNGTKFLKPIYKSGSEPYGEKDIYIKDDEFSSTTEPSSNFYDGSDSRIFLKVNNITQEKAELTVGFEGEALPGPAIEVSPPSKPVIRKGETATFTVTVKVGEELLSPDLIPSYVLFQTSSSGNITKVGSTGSALHNPFTITVPGYPYTNPDTWDGAIWVDIPAGVIRHNNKDSNAVMSEKLYIDNTPPEITLKGNNPYRISKGTPYSDPGAIATDNLDSEIEGKLQIDSTQVNTDSLGTYTVTYSVTDHAGHITTKERTVIVEEGLPPHEHHFSANWENDANHHWHECECGDKADLAAHVPEPIPGQAATCTQPGKTEGSRCSICGRILVAQEDISIKGHSYSEEWKSDVENHWQECTACEEKRSLAAHTPEPIPGKEATCTQPGKTDGSRCSVCDRILVEQRDIPKTNHEISDVWHYGTIYEDDLGHWHECVNCQTMFDLGLHVEDGGTVTKEPTQEETGIKTYSCSVCGYVMRTEVLDKLDPSHTHSYPEQWSHDTSNHWKECITCHEKTDQAPHTWDSGTVTTVPSSSKAGEKTYTCTVCKRTWTETIPATGGGSSGGGGGGGGSTPIPAEYKVTLPGKTVGGSVRASSVKAVKGTKVTLSVEAEEGYELEDLGARDKKGKEITLEEKEGKYTFSMPASDVEIIALFRELPKDEHKEEAALPSEKEPDPIVLPFTDVPEKAWYYDAVKEVYNRGIMTGLSETQFAPELPASRGMVVTMLYRMEGQPAIQGGAGFTDVPGKQYYAPAVAWATGLGLIKGYGDGSFRPNEGITREQLVTILYRYAEWKGQDVDQRADLSGFFDTSRISPYAQESMAWAKAAGLLNGTDWGGIDPGGEASRGQIAVILERFLEL